MATQRPPRCDERGQVLVIVAVGMFAMVAMAGLVIDGGHAWGQQRDTQNGTDAAAHAGAVALAQNIPYTTAKPPQTPPNSDADVAAAVDAIAAENGIAVPCAFYTDIEGNRLAGPQYTDCGPSPQSGARVGHVGGSPPAGAEGVQALGEKEFGTFLGGILGMTALTARVDATAVAGFVEGLPGNAVIPVTFPRTITLCENNGEANIGTVEWPINQHVVVPLCKVGPGSVGWLDWTPPAGGTSELEEAIRNPNGPPITIPEWHYVAQTGNQNAQMVEDALNDLDPPLVLIPLFDATCETDPPGAGIGDCPGGPGHGQNQWYHFPQFAAFEIDYVTFKNNGECGAWSGAGCFVGWFRYMIYGPTTVRSATLEDSPLGIIGVQLID